MENDGARRKKERGSLQDNVTANCKIQKRRDTRV